MLRFERQFVADDLDAAEVDATDIDSRPSKIAK
jgi:hypothetical protein